MYHPEMCETAIEVMSKGGLLADVAQNLGIDTNTITDWRSRYPMFDAAIEAGLIFSEEYRAESKEPSR